MIIAKIWEVGEKTLADVEKTLRVIPGGTEIALSRSMNRAMLAARTMAVKETGRHYEIPASEIKSASRLTRAKKGLLSSTMQVIGSPMSLMHFKPSSTSPTYYPTKLRVTVKKGERKIVKGGFVASNNSGTTTFKRTGKASLPIEKRYGPSVPQMVGNSNVVDKTQERAEKVFAERLDREIDYLLSK